ncbi:ABC transporter ATP-binding protein [Symbiobacterium terraclitae]|uniref:ABC transporter ATP-binding protein n=1 Tax=Symbiobacterium terraclitae TaxID=557451 RepID=UPI0035B535D7
MSIPVRRYWRLLRRYLRPERARVTWLALLLVLSIALQLMNPQILRRFLDLAAGEVSGGLSLTALALLFIAIAFGAQLVNILARYLSESVSWRATNALRADLAEHCLRLDLSFHKNRTPGEMVERIDGDVTSLSEFFSQLFIGVVANLALMAGILVLLYREDWRAGLAMTAYVLFTLWLLGTIRRISVPHVTRQRQAVAEFYGFLGEVLAGTEAIRASGARSHMLRRHLQMVQDFYRHNLRASMMFGLMWGSSIFTFALGAALSLGVGAWLHARGAATVGTVYLLFHYTELIRRPIDQLRAHLQELQRAGAAVERVEELFALRSRVPDRPGRPLPAGPLSVQLEGVSFAYEPGAPVLKGVDLHLRPGEVLGMLGRTGSGKSTLARLLLRFYDPDEGAVRLGGVDLREAKVAEVRRRVAFVTQDVQLFAGTVRDNLTFFDPGVSDERLREVLEELGLGLWLRSLPRGLDTPLESGGGGLSAGEAQLLALARVFLADPGLVILDEASSRLDPATEALVERAVDRLLEGRTAVIIAHRLATVDRADTIVILEDGQIVERGMRAGLAADPESRFARLLRTGVEEVLV